MMLSKFFKPRHCRTILFISLSNIGDVVLTFPVFDALCESYPEALFSVIVSSKGRAFFEGHPRVKKVHTLEKQSGILEKVRWIKDLRRDKFDLIVDLRNSMLPFLARGHRRTRPVFAGEAHGHMREKHLRRLKGVLKDVPVTRSRHVLWTSKEQELAALSLIKGFESFVVVAPGAADNRKRWTPEGFTKVIQFIVHEQGIPVVVVGDRRDQLIAEQVLKGVTGNVLSICGLTSLKAMAVVLGKARLALVNDSGIMHLASYLDVPTIALFGPTDPERYGPWGKKAVVERSPSGRMADIPELNVINAVSKALR